MLGPQWDGKILQWSSIGQCSRFPIKNTQKSVLEWDVEKWKFVGFVQNKLLFGDFVQHIKLHLWNNLQLHILFRFSCTYVRNLGFLHKPSRHYCPIVPQKVEIISNVRKKIRKEA